MSEHIDKTINETLTINRTETINKTETITKTEPDDDHSMKSVENRLHLMEIYLSEWQHRDTLFWKQIFMYFFSSLVVMLLPFMEPWGLHLPDDLPHWLFPAAGLVMSVIFFVVAEGYIVRLKCVRTSYQNLITTLPDGFQRENVRKVEKGRWGKLLDKSMAKLISRFMFISLVSIGVMLIIVTAK